MKNKYLKCIVVIVTVLFVLSINTYFEFFALNIPKSHEKIEGSFRVMTFNLNAAKDIIDLEGFKLRLINEINKLSPDILCVQELSDKNMAAIQPALDSVFQYSDISLKTKYEQRCYLFSNLPIRNIKNYKCEGEIDTTGFDLLSKQEVTIIRRQMPVYSADVLFPDGKQVTVFNCHLRSNAYSTARRTMDKRSSWFAGIPLYISNYKNGVRIRNYESDNIKPSLDSISNMGIPIIVMGDMNSLGNSYCLKKIKDNKLHDAWWMGGLGFGITFDAWHLLLRLDHILYDARMELNNVFVSKSNLSDHRPLIADFTITK